MSDKNHVQDLDPNELVIKKAKDFWTRYSKSLTIAAVAIIVLGGGYYGYKNFIQKPKEEKAQDAMFKAEEFYRTDSANLALNGQGTSYGFLKIMSKFSGTDAANLAHFYAGDCYIKLGDNNNAIKYLKDFSTSDKPVQARAYKLMADAYGDMGKFQDAVDYYKKAANEFTDDQENTSEYLFLAANCAHFKLKDDKQAKELFQELNDKYPNTRRGFESVKYLGELGVYSSSN
ncbi:MAG: tetratricopeptide repeat protein [Bacteroidetes bacterium]|nr:tetratricopeptide repeat protein [Bacteroidota bacterium]